MLGILTAVLMCHLMKIALCFNNCKAQDEVDSEGWLQRASSPLICPLQSEGAILFSTDGTQHQDWLNTNLASPSVFSCLLLITYTQPSGVMFLYLHIPFCYFQAFYEWFQLALLWFGHVFSALFVTCLYRKSESHLQPKDNITLHPSSLKVIYPLANKAFLDLLSTLIGLVWYCLMKWKWHLHITG